MTSCGMLVMRVRDESKETKMTEWKYCHNLMALLLLVCALAIAGCSAVSSAAHESEGGPGLRHVMIHEDSKTYVWHVRGSEIVGLTTYGVDVSRSLVRRHYPLADDHAPAGVK